MKKKLLILFFLIPLLSFAARTEKEKITISNDFVVVSNANFQGSVTFGGETKTNWPTGMIGIGHGILPSTTNLVANAGIYTVCDISLTNNATLRSPTNANYDGKKMQFRIKASGGDRTVTLNTNEIIIPSSSSMTNIFVINSNTITVILLDYYATNTNWWVESYITGY